jgi:hypothetical protein
MARPNVQAKLTLSVGAATVTERSAATPNQTAPAPLPLVTETRLPELPVSCRLTLLAAMMVSAWLRRGGRRGE